MGNGQNIIRYSNRDVTMTGARVQTDGLSKVRHNNVNTGTSSPPEVFQGLIFISSNDI